MVGLLKSIFVVPPFSPVENDPYFGCSLLPDDATVAMEPSTTEVASPPSTTDDVAPATDVACFAVVAVAAVAAAAATDVDVLAFVSIAEREDEGTATFVLERPVRFKAS